MTMLVMDLNLAQKYEMLLVQKGLGIFGVEVELILYIFQTFLHCLLWPITTVKTFEYVDSKKSDLNSIQMIPFTLLRFVVKF